MKSSAHQVKHWTLQLLRRGVQISVVLLLAGLVYLSLYAHFRAAFALEDEIAAGGFRGTVLAEFDRRIAAMDDPQRFLDANQGTIWSMQLGGLDLTDPLAAAEAVAAGKTLYRPLLLWTLLPVLITMLLGKVFCSWICPANLLLEITGKLRGLLRLAELPPAEVKFSRANKYVLLGVGLIVAAIVGLPMFALIYPPAALSRLVHAWILGTSMAGMLTVLGLIVAFELLVSPRWWCRTMCPGGALYGLLGWPRLLRVKLDGDRCTKCRQCEPVCEPGLIPVLQSYGIECDNCGECVRKCPERALGYTVGLPAMRGGTKLSGKRPITKVATTLLLPAVIFLTPATALAHHILGLPHYSYKENYPQAPVKEYPASTGPYEIVFVSYPGDPVPGAPANLAFYIKNGASGEPYDAPISVRVLQTFTFGNNREVLPASEIRPLEVPHKISVTFPEDGEYIVELSLDVEGEEEVISFLVIAGNPSASTSVLLAVGGGLAVFLITVRAIKKKRDRRKATCAAY